MTSTTAQGRAGVLGVLREAAGNPDLRRLQVGNAAWGSGEAAYVIGLTVVVFELGGTAAVAILALVRALPSVLLAPVLTTLADRVPTGTQLRVVLAVRVATVAAATAVLAAGGSIVLLLLLAGIDSVAATLLRPIRGALVPAVARSPEELVAGNVATTTGDSLAALIGPAIAAVLLIVAGPPSTLVAGVLLIGAALAAAVGLDDRSASEVHAHHADARRPSGVLGGLRDLAGLPQARLIVTLFVAQRFVRGAFAVLVVAAAIELVGMGEPGVGWLSGAVGLGGLAGGVVALGLVGRRRLVPAFLAGIVAWGAGIALPGVVPIAAASMLALAVAGVGKVVLDVAGFSLLQRTVPTEVRGRVLGTLEGLVTAALALGSVVAAWLIEAFGPAVAMVAIGALPIVAVALAWLPIRGADDVAQVRERELRLLRTIPLFRPLGLNALERVAAAVRWHDVAPGEVVVRESALGDRFYMIESGQFEVTRAGAPLRMLGPGDSFGEIALLRAVPRTATVAATEPGALASIDGEAFLAAVNGHEESAAAAEAQACDRLLSRLG